MNFISIPKTLAIYGGSFDPPHIGHLSTARFIQEKMHFDRFVFLPCKQSVLKAKTMATAAQRIHMLTLALHDDSTFKIDQRELLRHTPSYMVNTLRGFRRELGKNVAISLIIGMDVFLQLPQWHAWEKLLSLSNLLVIKRTSNSSNLDQPDSTLAHCLLQHETSDYRALLTTPFGKIYCEDAGQFPISSSELRQKLGTGETIFSDVIPKAVLDYIKREGIYGA